MFLRWFHHLFNGVNLVVHLSLNRRFVGREMRHMAQPNERTQQTTQKCISTPNNDFISLARRLLISSLTLLVFFTPSCSSTSSHFLVLKSYSNRLGPLQVTLIIHFYLIGEDHQICIFGLCLFIT